MVPNLGPSPHGVWCNIVRKLATYIWCAKMRTLSNSVEFSAGRLLLPAYNFSATMASTSLTLSFGAMASLKFLGTENMPRIRQCAAAALVTILPPDNWIPSSLHLWWDLWSTSVSGHGGLLAQKPQLDYTVLTCRVNCHFVPRFLEKNTQNRRQCSSLSL